MTLNRPRSVTFIWLAVTLLGWATLDVLDAHLPDGAAALAAAPWLVWQFTPIIIIPMIYVVVWYVRGRRRSGQAIGARDAFFGAATLFCSWFCNRRSRVFPTNSLRSIKSST